MNKDKYGSMSDDELRELAKEKFRASGRFTKSAIRAQEELYNRHHWCVSDSHYIADDDGRDLVDVQYNG